MGFTFNIFGLMYETIFIGKQIVIEENINSTNSFAKQLLSDVKKQVIEGLVVTTKNQDQGRGQMGTKWVSSPGKNLTFSLVLKPRIEVANQFLLSKVVSLGIVDCLIDLGIGNVKIKWPNDIYVDGNKVAGILIENTLSGKIIDNCIVGIGLNVNQEKFEEWILNPTSLKKITKKDFDLNKILQQLLYFLEKRYFQLKNNKFNLLDNDYLNQLYLKDELHLFTVENKSIEAMVIGVDQSGQLMLNEKGKIKAYGLKEVQF